MWHRDYGYSLRLPRNPWLLVLGVGAALVAASVLVALVVAALAAAVAVAVLVGGAWLAWQLTRALVGSSVRPHRSRAVRSSGRAGRRLRREARGLLELAATTDPMEGYLLAVREFERVSAAALELHPEDAGRTRTARRARELAEQADSLDDAVTEIERRLLHDRFADGARGHVWELAHAVREVEHYLDGYAAVRRRPRLAELRGLITRRAALTTRRTQLVDHLDAAEVTRTLGPRAGG